MGPWGPWGVCLSRHGTSMTGSRVDVVGGSPFGSSLWTAESPLWTPETAGMRLARCFAIFCRGVAISRSRFSSEKGGGAPYSHSIPQQDVNRRRFFRCLSILRAECPALTGSLDSPADISGRWGLAVVSCPHDGRRMERKSTTGSTAMESTEINIHLSFLGSASPRSWAAKPAMTSRPHPRYRRLGWTARDAEAAARSLNLPGPGESWTQHKLHSTTGLKKTSWNQGAKISCAPSLHRNPASVQHPARTAGLGSWTRCGSGPVTEEASTRGQRDAADPLWTLLV